jgi:hypothetical protein
MTSIFNPEHAITQSYIPIASVFGGVLFNLASQFPDILENPTQRANPITIIKKTCWKGNYVLSLFMAAAMAALHQKESPKDIKTVNNEYFSEMWGIGLAFILPIIGNFSREKGIVSKNVLTNPACAALWGIFTTYSIDLTLRLESYFFNE